MATAPPPTLNGRPRKQLSDQLDRLDDIINGLAECLPEAVADAARDGIRQAFRDVVRELVTDPAVLEKLRASILPELAPAISRPSAFARLKAVLKAAACRSASFVAGCIAQTVAAPRRIANAVRQSVRTARSSVALGRILGMPIRTIAAVGLGLGLAAAAVSYAAPREVAAVISGFSASTMAIGLQVARWLRSRRFALAN